MSTSAPVSSPAHSPAQVPALFVSHGAPLFAVDAGETGPALTRWGQGLRAVGCAFPVHQHRNSGMRQHLLRRAAQQQGGRRPAPARAALLWLSTNGARHHNTLFFSSVRLI